MSTIPILSPVTTGYRDAFAAIRAMPALAGYAFLIMLAINLSEFFIPARAVESIIAGTLLSLTVSAVQNFLLTPIMIAVHRYVVLDEVTSKYALDPGQKTFRAFFAWLMALSALGFLAFLFGSPKNDPTLLSLGVVMIGLVVMIVVTTRLSILFPAIAVDSPGATAANAWADSKQHTFRIFLIFLLSVLPIVIGALIVIVPFVLNSTSQSDAPPGIAAMLVMSVVQMFFMVLCVAIASRLYQALADRLLRSV
jgi:hypothetical protein